MDSPTRPAIRTVKRVTRAARPTRVVRRAPAAVTAPPPISTLPPSTGTVGAPPVAYAGGQVGSGGRVGLLGNKSVFDTPFNVTNYTSELINNQMARSASDVFANDPSVRATIARYNPNEQIQIRGFNLNASEYSFDGLYGLVDNRRTAIEAAERIEVIKGPNALLNGISPGGNIGGAVNIVPKRATIAPITDVSTVFTSRNQPGVVIDAGRRYGQNAEWGMRFNGSYRDGNTPLDNNEQQFGVGALALDYRGERFRLSTDFVYQDQRIRSSSAAIGVNPGFAIPAAPKGTINQQQPWETFDSSNRFLASRAEYDLTNNITVYAAGGAGRFREDPFISRSSIINSAGDLSSFVVGYFPTQVESQTGEIGLRSVFDTGLIRNRFTVAASILDQQTKTNIQILPVAIESNLYNPRYVARPSTAGLNDSVRLTSSLHNQSVAVANTFSDLDERVLLTVGGRFQQIEQSSFAFATGNQTSGLNSDAVTPLVGLVLKPTKNLSFYGNYIEGLRAGGVAPQGTVNGGQIFPAFVSTQKEVGVKYDFGTFGATAAVFEIQQPFARTNTVTNTYLVDGLQQNRGIELNVFGEPLAGVRLLGGVAFYNPVLERTDNGLNDGNRAPGVPRTTFNLYGEYDLPHWMPITLTARVIYTTSQFYDAENLQSIPHWTRFDLGARYAANIAGVPAIFRFAVENVADTAYYASAARGFITPGAPRTYLASATFKF